MTDNTFSARSVILVAIVAFVLLVGLVCVISAVSYYNYGNATEQALEAQYQNNQNVLAAYSTKIVEMSQIPQIYKKDLSEIIQKNFEGRYGKGGSKAVITFVHENNLNLDPKLYRNIEESMEGGRDQFQAAQSSLIDLKRSYQTQLGSVWAGFWLHVDGYPRVNLAKYQPIINEHTATSFATHRDEGVKLPE